MPRIRKFDQLRAGDRALGLLRELRIMAELRPHFGRCVVFAYGGRVLHSDHQQGWDADQRELVDDGLGEDHVVDEAHVAGDDLTPRPLHETGEHIDPPVVFRSPLSGVIGRSLIGADALGGHRLFPLDLLVDRPIGNAHRLPVLEPDRIEEDERRNRIRKHEGVTGGDHAARRMADDDRPVDSERREQRARVCGQLLE